MPRNIPSYHIIMIRSSKPESAFQNQLQCRIRGCCTPKFVLTKCDPIRAVSMQQYFYVVFKSMSRYFNFALPGSCRNGTFSPKIGHNCQKVGLLQVNESAFFFFFCHSDTCDSCDACRYISSFLWWQLCLTGNFRYISNRLQDTDRCMDTTNKTNQNENGNYHSLQNAPQHTMS